MKGPRFTEADIEILRRDCGHTASSAAPRGHSMITPKSAESSR